MKRLGTVALMLSLGSAGTYAQQRPVNMTVSGTAGSSAINLVTGAPTSEYDFGGNGTLGQFTFRTISASSASPQQSSTCPSPKIYFPTVAGAGVFRFQDGSLLKVQLTQGSDCIDLAAGLALCIRTFQVTGGTGRFHGASGGTISLTETVVPVSFDTSGNPVFFTAAGMITGSLSGAAVEEAPEEARR